MSEGDRSTSSDSVPYRVLVYGGGAAGLMTAFELASHGVDVDLLGPVPAARWPCLSEAGINTGHDEDALFRQTISCGGDLAPRPPVRAMAAEAATLVDWLTAIGVPFHRDEAGALALRRLDGATEPDAAFVEGQTAAQITNAIDDQVTRLSAPLGAGGARGDGTPKGQIRRREHVELVALVLDDDERCIGCIAQDLVSMDMVPFCADAVVLATGGPETMFGSPSRLCTESASAAALEAGAAFANADLVQLHPATLSMAEGRLCILSSAIRAESGRFWVPRSKQDVRIPKDIPKGDRDYFLAEAHPDVADLVTDDVAAHAIRRVCWQDERGVYDRQRKANMPLVYLDVSHLPDARLSDRIGSELSACQQITGVDPAKAPLEVAPGATLRLGGLWLDFEADDDGRLVQSSPRNHRTSIRGLYAASGAGNLYHGHCRMGGNGLLADLFAGRLTARAVCAFCEQQPASDPDDGAFAEATDRAMTQYAALLERQDDDDGPTGGELTARLRTAMSKLLLGEPSDDLVERARQAVARLNEQAASSCADDWCEQANRGAPALRNLSRMLRLAELLVESTSARRAKRSQPPQAVLARLEGETITVLDHFTHHLDDQPTKVTPTIDPGGVPAEARRPDDVTGGEEDPS